MELLQKFIEYLTLEKNYSTHTITAYQNDIHAFFCFVAREHEVSDPCLVPSVFVREWVLDLHDSGLSNRSVNRKITALKSFYNYLQKIEVVVESPLSNQKSLKRAQKVIIPFSEKEIDAVLTLEDERYTPFENLRNKTMIHLFYATGIRQGELMGLEVQDVDFESATIKVLGKRNKERLVPLYPEILTLLKTYMEQREGMEVSIPNLFLTARGGKLYNALVYRVINTYFSEVSTKEKRSPHVLRHSYATDMLSKGADLNSVKELLGHSSLAATQVYTHNSLEKLKQVYNQAHPRSAKKK
ncbi:MAG: tyrosine-type recombinase/integrase [Wenyingzhuangia sp.]|jgi:integrase/recombinase XerC|uniref:tyrosine-type recombinase/integrase n=1 Tax=Wenyingzhuangia sp. TaxID=1964193 RepID=UPI00321B45FC